MKKYVFTFFFLLLFMGFAAAQLTLQKVENGHKKTLPIGALIEIKLPTKTSRPDCNCFESYKGYLKKVENNGIELVLTEQVRETVDGKKNAFQEIKTFQQPKEPMITRIPLTKVLAISRYSETNEAIKNTGAVFFTLAALSNLFLTPHLDAYYATQIRNGGYIVMGAGLLTAFLPTKRIFYFEHPKNKKKTLWKLGS